jgi:hypothetical protein
MQIATRLLAPHTVWTRICRPVARTLRGRRPTFPGLSTTGDPPRYQRGLGDDEATRESSRCCLHRPAADRRVVRAQSRSGRNPSRLSGCRQVVAAVKSKRTCGHQRCSDCRRAPRLAGHPGSVRRSLPAHVFFTRSCWQDRSSSTMKWRASSPPPPEVLFPRRTQSPRLHPAALYLAI